MKLLQAFAISVAASAIGASKKEVSDGIDDYDAGNPPRIISGYSAIGWAALIEAIMAAISGILDNCPQKNAELRASIRKPTRGQRVNTRREIRRNVDDCFGFGWRRQADRVVNEVLDQAASASDDEIDAVIAEARS